MSDVRGAAQGALDALVKSGGLLGAGLVSRDGLPILMRFTRPIQEETFCAMAAALLGAAEAAMQEMSGAAPAAAVVESADMRLHVAGLDDTHLLVAAAPASLDAARVRDAVEKARTGLRGILGG